MKLIRDKLALTPYEGRTVMIVDEATQGRLILDKLVEEAVEVAKAKTREAMIEEIADVREVLTRLGKLHNISYDEVLTVQQKKALTRGVFNQGYVLL